jgi:transcription-repair coupling factor (superfamily II helicase)
MLLHTIIASYIQSAEYTTFAERVKSSNSSHYVEGISSSSYPLLIASYFAIENCPIIVILPSAVKASEFISDISSLIEQEYIYSFSSLNMLPYEFINPAEHVERERVSALYALFSKKACIVVTDIDAVMRKIPGADRLKQSALSLEKGEEIPFDDLIETLVNFGYTREHRVDSYGTFAIKGGILDIFAAGSESPVRIDFFGDEIDSIRNFDLDSQRSKDEIEHVVIFPRREIILTQKEKDALVKLLQKKIIDGKKLPEKLKESVESGIIHDDEDGIYDLFGLIGKTESFFSYTPPNSIIFTIERSELLSKRESLIHTYNELYERKSAFVTIPPDQKLDIDTFDTVLEKSCVLQTFMSHPGALSLQLKSVHSYNGKIKELREELATRLDDGWKVIISTAFEGQARRLQDILKEFKPSMEVDSDSQLIINLSSYSSGLEIGDGKILLLTDHDIFGKSYRRKKSFKKKSSTPLKSFLDLNPGDYVVHINHGIGVFKKIERMSAGGFERDFLLLEYADGDKLYVSLDQLTMVQKYIGFDGKEPRIDALGKKSAWNRIKKKVKESIEELAHELIEIYAKRKALKGFQYPLDTTWQEEFETNFEYEETPDQLNAIEDVKDDMESSRPMDRLVCGDVGFGKTEVAIRAAFKAAMAGRQTALLVPTTILALQHYNTFKKRFSEYPIQVEMISRFRSQKHIKDTKTKLAGGDVDIIIGTHALLSKDVAFKNLGLLIIDEEQRFGVKHKERLKSLRAQVDVLTLSATPIPRTLHMSMAGIRDLSIIMTPPENRQSIETYVLEENPDILQMAVKRELERNGQVFFVHNRVQSIDQQAEMLSELIPEASIAIAHGQMAEHQLEDIMVDFLDKKYDILIATTIIESGLDMPDVNTIIVNRADTFGLSQLYQLKGRVGRSSRKAFAYFFYPRHIPLNEVAQKRLRVISEYTDLGSGFKVAMKDLEIRGAGNLLGKQQSGNIMEVGFDLYTQMLEEAVSKLKGEFKGELCRTPVFFKTDNYIPDEYIPDEKQKIEFYKRFEGCETIEEIETLENEIKDRFGEYPGQVEILIELERIRTLASLLCIEEILEGEKSIRIKMSERTLIDTRKIVELINKNDHFMVDPQGKDSLIYYSDAKTTIDKMREIKKWLHDMSVSVTD